MRKILKEKNHKISDAFKVVDRFFQLGFKIEKIWDFINEVFNMWDSIDIKIKGLKSLNP